MAYTIKLDEEFISTDELQLIRTKHAILEKLRGRFGEYVDRDGWETSRGKGAKELFDQRVNHSR